MKKFIIGLVMSIILPFGVSVAQDHEQDINFSATIDAATPTADCTFDLSGFENVNFGNITSVDGWFSAPVDYDCNVPVRVEIERIDSSCTNDCEVIELVSTDSTNSETVMVHSGSIVTNLYAGDGTFYLAFTAFNKNGDSDQPLELGGVFTGTGNVFVHYM